MGHALIVDDDIETARTMVALMAQEGYTAAIANTLRDARRQLALQQPDVVLLDLELPDGSGIELFDDAQLVAQSEIVFITGHASVETSVRALRLGAADYLTKPLDFEQLRAILSRTMRPAQLRADIEAMQAEWLRSGRFGHLWGRSPAMHRVYEQIARVAGTAVTVLVTGESGTGKELAAHTVHDLSRRRRQPFLAINCGAVSPQLIESELFGHEKGSFTGADRQRQGYFERARGGTLFLDEIADMPLALQVKLLRVLETGAFTRVGSSVLQQADVRVIAATNRRPERAVADGLLREDLFYRLNVFPIEMPPLRARPDDVPLLAQQFLAHIARREGAAKHFTPAALRQLALCAWPGNVRELRNAVQRAYVMAPHEAIGEDWLPVAVAAPGIATRAAVHAPSLTLPLGISLPEAERRLILATLQHYGNHKERTAAVLGVSLKTLYNRLKDYEQSAEPDAPGDKAA